MAILGGRAMVRHVLRGLVIAAASLSLPSAHAADAKWPNAFSGVYKLSFNGFNVGTYRFNADFLDGSYSATGKADVSALFGAFKWKGDFAGKGALEGPKLTPRSFEMNYKSNKKPTTAKIGFNGTAVSAVAIEPPKPPSPEMIPLKPENLQNVLDPIAAMIAVSDATPASACNRTIPVFDGRQRYDLQLSFKGREMIRERHPSGQPKELVLCRVKYLPIAGHKPKDFVDPWIDYNNIEVALRAVPTAGIYVPYRVSIPSPLGSAVMTADTVKITAANNQQIALKQ
jgi:hypothetical protein